MNASPHIMYTTCGSLNNSNRREDDIYIRYQQKSVRNSRQSKANKDCMKDREDSGHTVQQALMLPTSGGDIGQVSSPPAKASPCLMNFSSLTKR